MSEKIPTKLESKEVLKGDYNQTFCRENFGLLELSLGNDKDATFISIVEDPSQPSGFYVGGIGIIGQNGEVALHEGKNIIGRSPDCDVVIANESKVSRYHLGIELDEKYVHIHDLGSTNGTYPV